MKIKGITISISLILLLISNSANGQNTDTLQLKSKIDSIMSASYKADEPGAAVLVYNKGSVLFKKGYGVADSGSKEAITTSHKFCIGSITKQFTAMATLLLEEQGRLSIKDPIHKYLPDYPHRDKTITIENLLTHTSGMIDVFENQNWYSMWERELTPEEFVDVFKNDSLLTEPGTAYHYSNFGYAVLGLIIEKVSGLSLSDFLKQNIFIPLGMNNTSIPKTGDAIANLAKGYFSDDKGVQPANPINLSHLYGAGSIFTTADDLLKWYLWLGKRYKNGDVQVKRALSEFTFKNGNKSNNGYGMMLFKVHGKPAAGNNGGMLGYTNYTLWMYEDDLIIVLLSNHRYEGNESSMASRFDVNQKALRVAESVMGKSSQLFDPKSVVYINIPPATLEKYTGMYKIGDTDTYRIISLSGNQLYSKISKGGTRLAINPVSDKIFYSATGSKFEFVFDKEGNIKEANYHKPDGTISVGTRTNLPLPPQKQPAIITEADYNAVCGLYKMMVVFDINIYRAGANGIIAESKQQGKMLFYPESPLKFYSSDDDGMTIEFLKNKKGDIDSFKMIVEGRGFNASKVDTVRQK